ncbi:hypothetical protein HY772_01300, partial [Candidatus Woesearchaeota archaeon]|nr:hypothetical protein [Candidatus Woesearchaeota archaeon]
MKSSKAPTTLLLVFFLLLPLAYAADDSFKPWLHKASVPESPKVRLFGQYATNLFPGAATYVYGLEVPKGTNSLQPTLTLSYNSQSVKQRPGILGAGWVLTPNYIYRDVNATPDNTSDEKYILVLDGTPYELVFGPDGQWHTEVDYHYKIENLSGNYWQLTRKDGTKYRFGYNTDSSLASNTGQSYVVRWSLDLVTDTHDNKIYYTYLENPFAQDNGSVYLDKVEYNNDKKRKITFNYESSVRPDRRLVYEQGNLLEESRRVTDIAVYTDNSTVRRYHLEYTNLSQSLSSLSGISYYGSDNVSLLHNITFIQYVAEPGYTSNATMWVPPVLFSDNVHTDYGARLADVNND